MGQLRHPERDAAVLLAYHRVGRAAACDLVLDGAGDRVSRSHAVIVWHGGRWTVRDLGSRNGTTHNDHLVPPGNGATLVVGDVLCFGHPSERWTLVHDGPPDALARTVDGGSVQHAAGGILALPSEADCLAVVRRDAAGHWVIDHGGLVRRVEDGEHIRVGEHAWALSLPGRGDSSTVDASAIEGRRWRVEVDTDPDEHRVAVRLAGPSGAVDLGTRAHHRLVLVLARERLLAQRRGHPEADAGWVSIEDLTQHFGITSNALHVQLFRLRGQLASCALPTADVVLERRFNGELRLGTAQVTVSERG